MASSEGFLEVIDALAASLREFHKSDPSTLSARHGVAAPPLDAEDLAVMVETLAKRVRSLDWEGADERAQVIFDDLVDKAKWVTANAVPNLQGSNTVNSIVSFITSADFQIFSAASPAVLATSRRLPSNLKRDVARAAQRLKTALAGIEDIELTINKINRAYEASEKLDATIEDLEEALRQAVETKAEIDKLEAQARLSAGSADEAVRRLTAAGNEASETMGRVNAAFRAATSHGLAHAFRAKATWLNASMYVWAGVLIAALWFAIGIGGQRFPLILAAVASQPGVALNWGLLVMQIALAALSLGAPVWVAWVATKQIGQRFRLAEDYAYKAALSAAYEGYRSEAAELDPLLKAQLFSIALTRLDEIPLRLVEQHVAGSPMHELLGSEEFRRAIKQVPDLKERVIGIINRIPSGLSNGRAKPPIDENVNPQPG